MWGGITRTKIDEVEVFWAEAPGPPLATLTFRVGVVDETLFVRGITHMVEHLALQPLALQTYQYNGFVDQLRTTFTASGEPDELAGFLRTVCAGVTNPPIDRLEHERQILLTESGQHDAGGLGALLATRYGPRGPGLIAYGELGLHHVDGGRIREWARQWFRPENAVLWLNKEPRPGLELPLDAGGTRRTVEDTEALPLTLPAWIEQGERGVAASYVHSRSVGSTTCLQILERRLQQELRYERGLAYEVSASYLAMSGRTAHAAIWTDVLKENAATARDVTIETLRRLAEEGPTEEEVDQRKRDLEKAHADPLAIPGKLDWLTQVFLLDPAEAERDLTADTEAMTTEDVKQAAAELGPGAIYVVPSGTTMPARYEKVPLHSTDEVRGRVHRPVGTIAGGDQKLVVGDDGVTLQTGKGQRATIWFDRCEAMLKWSNGYRILFGSDGWIVQVRPAAWQRGRRAVTALDQRLADRAIEMHTDPPDKGAEERGGNLWVAGVAGLMGISALINAFEPGEHDTTGTVFYAILAAALLTVSALAVRKQLRKEK